MNINVYVQDVLQSRSLRSVHVKAGDGGDSGQMPRSLELGEGAGDS